MSYRKINVGNKIWEYVIGKCGAKIRGQNKNVWVKNHKLLGMSEEEYEIHMRELYDADDDYSSNAIGPGHIKKYIEENLL